MERLLKSRYKIGEQISENPYSLTYRGSFLGSDKPVVIKIYKHGALNSSLISRMKQKVKEFSQLSHHGLARLIDGDYGWQGFYYVRDFIDGQSLQELLARGEKFDAEKTIALGLAVCQALAAVHQRGIIHGALKPSNILIDKKGFIKITDFVIEGEIKEAMPQKAQAIIADRRQFAPEELAGQSAGRAADIYNLGRILQAMMAEPPKFLQEIIDRAVQPDPLRRFASLAEFQECLEKQGLVTAQSPQEKYVNIFDSSVTQYGGEEIDRDSEVIQDLGRIRLRWSKEKHRNLILAVLLGLAVISGMLYAFWVGH